MASKNVPPPSTLDDPVYRRGVIELLGILAYGEISACERLAEDAKMAPDLKTKVEIAAMAAAEFGHFEKLRDRLVEIGEDPYETMQEFARSSNGSTGRRHRPTGSRDSSRRTSAMAWRLTSTVRSRPTSTRRPVGSCSTR